MAKELTRLVEELIELDPSLESRRSELTKVLSTMLDAAPSHRISKTFKRDLLRDLQSRFAHESEQTSPSLFMVNKWIFGAGGAVIGALLVLTIRLPIESGNLGVPTFTPRPTTEMAMDSSGMPAVNSVAPEAFGKLSQTVTAPGIGGGGGVRDQSGGGGGDAAMIAPYESYVVDYAYDGTVKLPEEDVSVLRRQKGGALPGNVSSIISGFASDLLNWDSLSGLKARTVTLTDSNTEPMSVTIDYVEGTVSMYKEYDWTKRPEANCQDQACYDRYRMKESDMPSDSTVIGTANAFLAKLGINVSDYGTPIVDKQWQYWLAHTEDKSMYYYPETLTVTYPFLINGLPVYEEYGQPVGLSVNVDIRHKEVSGLYNLQTLNFQSSSYKAVSDADKLEKFITSGGVNTWRDPNAQKTYTATLGDPEKAYVRNWKWDGSTSTELYVPALAFPVLFMPDEAQMDRQRVLIPLADELLVQPDYGTPIPLDTAPAVEPKPAVMQEPGADGIEE